VNNKFPERFGNCEGVANTLPAFLMQSVVDKAEGQKVIVVLNLATEAGRNLNVDLGIL